VADKAGAGAEADPFERFAGLSAFGAGIGGLLYSVLFIALVKRDAPTAKPAALCLMLSGLFAIPVVVALYQRLREQSGGFALLGLVFGILGAAGSLVHGGFDLGSLLHPAKGVALAANPQDPRGLLTFGASALAVQIFARLMEGSAEFPRRLAQLGYLLALLLVIIYLGRLIILDPNQPILAISAAVAGLVVGPAWYLWNGKLLRGRAAPKAE
jgi:hypothetical protein